MTSPTTRAAHHHEVMAAIHPKPKPEPRKKGKRVKSINKPAIVSARGWWCECGCGRPGEVLHHWLYKSKRFSKWLDVPENLVLITHKENDSRKYDNLSGRKKFWLVQCRRYGREHMEAWVKSLPAKLAHRVDFV